MTGSWVRRGLAFEAGVWRSLAVWTVRRMGRRDGSDAGTEHGYARTATPVFWLFIAMSAVEVVVAHLLIPWPAVQLASLVLGIWGLLWMLGMLAALHAHPHILAGDGLRLRHGFTVDVQVPWSQVASVTARRRDHQGIRSVRVEPLGDDAQALAIVVSGETTVDVALTEPVHLDLPAGPVDVSGVRLHADDPHAFVSGARAQLTSTR